MGDGMDKVLTHAAGASIDRLIPHKGRMKLVDSLIAFQRDEKTGDVRVQLSADAPYFVGQVFQSHWLIELMAQAGAVISQLLRIGVKDDEPPLGFLIAIRNFTWLDMRPLVPGTILRIQAHFDVDLDPVGNCISKIFTEDDALIAQSEMTFLSNEAGAV